jgi:hypothetical protein
MRVVVVGEDEVFCLDYFGSAAVNLRKHYAIECSECKDVLELSPIHVSELSAK